MFNFHIHKWEIIDSQKAESSYFGYGKSIITLILYKCSICGKNKTEEIDGWWDTQELQGE